MTKDVNTTIHKNFTKVAFYICSTLFIIRAMQIRDSELTHPVGKNQGA